MTREEYNQRRRQIEERHRATIELIEAGRLAQLRALDHVWLTAAEGREPIPPSAEEPAQSSSPGRNATDSSKASLMAPAADPAPTKRRRAYELLEQIEAALPSLPNPFDYHDLRRVLGIELDRGAVRRNLELLVEEEILGKESPSNGRFRLLYRKLVPRASPETD